MVVRDRLYHPAEAETTFCWGNCCQLVLQAADDLKWNYNLKLKLTLFQEEDLLPTDVNMLEKSAITKFPLDYVTILTSDLIRRIKKIPSFSWFSWDDSSDRKCLLKSNEAKSHSANRKQAVIFKGQFTPKFTQNMIFPLMSFMIQLIVTSSSCKYWSKCSTWNGNVSF